ncbi:unnamed protein product [Mytilus coruscus]|uniref:Uncharacterized protein n=1 Tax=Mytilus coruscus TaxID=42192 RepID=A0A6J8D6P7_MYTCO|nr:unnamed protein product [Mytilus coruscus]
MMLNENNELEKELGDLRDKMCHSKTKHTQALKMKSYFKGKYQSVKIKAEESKSDSKKYEKEINYLQKQVEGLQAMADDNKTEKLEMFSGGRYKIEIRQVNMDLVGNGVAIERCEVIVRSVLNNLLNIEVDRLPKKRLASIIAIEAHVLSQAQAAETMLKGSNFTENIPPQVVTLNNATENTVLVKKAKKNKKSKRTNANKQSNLINDELAFQVNKYYAVAFTDRWYPGRCSELVDKDTAFLEFVHPSGKNYKLTGLQR